MHPRPLPHLPASSAPPRLLFREVLLGRGGPFLPSEQGERLGLGQLEQLRQLVLQRPDARLQRGFALLKLLLFFASSTPNPKP